MFSARAIMRTLGLATLLLIAVPAPEVRAHGDLAIEFDTCVLRVGPHRVHFSGYQPAKTKQEFCEDIPATGETIMVLDYFDAALRDMQIDFRVIKDVGADENGNLDNITVAHVPFAVRPTGTFNFEYNFPDPGKFVGLLTARYEGAEYKARFPFAVGTGNVTGNNYPLYGLLAVLLVAVAAFWFVRVRGQRASTATNTRLQAEGWANESRPDTEASSIKPTTGH